ncbi:MAG: hypothetical protein ACAH59_09475, partial [Pseudobdellovibrionaceae bacterium]
MKLLFISALSLFVASCTFAPNRTPANSEKPRHVIFTIHGISGNQNTWGYFAPATKEFLGKLDPNYEVIVSDFL